MCNPSTNKIYDPVWIKTSHDNKISCQITKGLIKADARYKVPKEWIDAHCDIPYIMKALILDDVEKIAECIKCQDSRD